MKTKPFVKRAEIIAELNLRLRECLATIARLKTNISRFQKKTKDLGNSPKFQMYADNLHFLSGCLARRNELRAILYIVKKLPRY